MKKIYLIITGFFICIYSYSQTKEEILQIQKETNIENLNYLEDEFAKEFKEKKDHALKLAKINNWPIKIEEENGKVLELMEVSIDGKPIYYSTDNVNAARTTRTNFLNTGGQLGLNLNGENLTAYVWDGGQARKTHQELYPRVTYIDGNSLNDHATHVMGTILAKGIVSHAKGMANKARGKSFNWNNDLSEMSNAASNGMLLSNHSYGYIFDSLPSWRFGAYDEKSSSLDRIMYNAPYYLMISSAGNDGFRTNPKPLNGNLGFDKLSGFKTAKNNLVIAAANPANIDSNGNLINVSIASFSSQGPTDDYRIKPDLCGDGINVFSSIAYSNNSYEHYSGTSMASPNVTGTLLLLQQHYRNLNRTYMKAATLKGLALHTADDFGTIGPDAITGWGLLNAKFAANTISDNGEGSIIEERSLSNNQTYTFNINSDGINPLIASISWTDYPGSINNGITNLSTPVIVNDLDIRITKKNITYYPYKLSNVTTTIKGDNRVDPFERIDIPDASGSYTITVSHKGNLYNNSQNYSLIVTGVSICPNNLNIVQNVNSGVIDNQNASDYIQASNVIYPNASVNYHAGNRVVLKPGFKATTGSIFRAYIEGCNSNSTNKNNFLPRSDNSDSFEIIELEEVDSVTVKISPNPNNGIFSVHLSENVSGKLNISNNFGHSVYEGELKNQKEFDINISNQPKGIYILNLVTSDGYSFSEKVILN